MVMWAWFPGMSVVAPFSYLCFRICVFIAIKSIILTIVSKIYCASSSFKHTHPGTQILKTLHNVMKRCFILTHATLNTEFIVGHKDVAKSDELVPVVNWSPRFAAKLKNRPHHMFAPGQKCLLCPSHHMSVFVGTTYFCAMSQML